MNSVKSQKYGLTPKEIEKKKKKLLSSERFRKKCNIHRVKKTKLLNDRLNRHNKKKYLPKRRNSKGNTNIGEKVLAEIIIGGWLSGCMEHEGRVLVMQDFC